MPRITKILPLRCAPSNWQTQIIKVAHCEVGVVNQSANTLDCVFDRSRFHRRCRSGASICLWSSGFGRVYRLANGIRQKLRVTREESDDVDCVHITNNCQAECQTKEPFLGISLIPAAYPVHATLIPVADAFLKSREVVVGVIQDRR